MGCTDSKPEVIQPVKQQEKETPKVIDVKTKESKKIKPEKEKKQMDMETDSPDPKLIPVKTKKQPVNILQQSTEPQILITEPEPKIEYQTPVIAPRNLQKEAIMEIESPRFDAPSPQELPKEKPIPAEKPKPPAKPQFWCNNGHPCTDTKALIQCHDCLSPQTTFGCKQCNGPYFCSSCKSKHLKSQQFYPRFQSQPDEPVTILVCPNDHHLKDVTSKQNYCDNCGEIKDTKWQCDRCVTKVYYCEGCTRDVNKKRGTINEVYKVREEKKPNWESQELPIKQDGQFINYFGIFWLDEDNEVLHQKFLKGSHRDRAFAFYSEVTSDRNANQSKLLVRQVDRNPPTLEEPKIFEPKDFGLQEKVEFLRDRAYLMNFQMEWPQIDPFDLQFQYRIYWVEENDQYYEFDEYKQVKIKRETLSMRESGLEQFEELSEGILCKLLLHNGQIFKMGSDHAGKYLSECRNVAIQEGWLKI